MKDFNLIQENDLDGALNALFLENFSQKEDEGVARFCMEKEYNVIINSKKEAALLARLNGKSGGGKNIMWFVLALVLLAGSSLIIFTGKNEGENIVVISPQTTEINSQSSTASTKNASTTVTSAEEKREEKKSVNTSPYITTDKFTPPVIDSLGIAKTYVPEVANEPTTEKEKELPYFNKAGLAHFAQVKEKMLQKLLKIDDLLYGKTSPGATMYKNTEVIVPPFVMSNFPVTNLEYKTFLADLVMQGRFEDMKKCLPKEEVWKEYGCPTLAKNYFSNEIYNDFPVVNIDLDASAMYCEWLQLETNEQLSAAAAKTSTTSKKSIAKKKQVIVRLPYDYEWIYSADAAFALIPDCAGYNTIYDPSEGLVDKGFFKRTSQVNKVNKSQETPMDKLSDVNRFGMTEAEILEIFKKAMNYKNVKSKSSGNPALPASYPDNVEACCLAGHVSELIKSKEGELKVRGCCWQNKDEYQKMLSVYNKNGASPFIGFRVLIITTERGSDKNPFW